MNGSLSDIPMLVVAGLIVRNGSILLSERPTGSWMEGYWEFPGGKVEPGEDPRAALERELLEELSIRCDVRDIEEAIYHRYPDRTVLLLFFHCEIVEGEPRGIEGQELKWVPIACLGEERILPADRPLVDRLVKRP